MRLPKPVTLDTFENCTAPPVVSPTLLGTPAETPVQGRVAFGLVHVVIMGCGRVGSALAQTLDQGGHSVAVVDQAETSFRKLGPGYGGQTFTGIGFDRDTLRLAGIERADAFAAVSSGDNSNILAARVARETFGIENVVARIYDPRRAEVYQRLGIPTVASVAWQTDQILRRILPEAVGDEWRDGSGRVALTPIPFGDAWVGLRVTRLEKESGARVAFLTRYGEGLLPDPDTVVQADDIIHVLLDPTTREAVGAILLTGPETH
jgi:trk system potassium uptake protein TrkA